MESWKQDALLAPQAFLNSISTTMKQAYHVWGKLLYTISCIVAKNVVSLRTDNSIHTVKNINNLFVMKTIAVQTS